MARERVGNGESLLILIHLQVIPRHSAIIFCPTKKNAENVAVMIARAVPK